MPVYVEEPQVYMPLELARREEFTARHQPALISHSQRSTNSARKVVDKPPHPRAQNISGQDSGNKIIKRNTAQGFVKCGDCSKPRVIYSDTALSRMVPPNVDGRVLSTEEETSCQVLVAETFSEACTSTTLVYGAYLYDIGHPFREVFITQGALTCADPIEPHFFTLSARLRCGLTEKMCCFCDEYKDQGPDEELTKLFMAFLPVCQACIAVGAKIVVRHAIRNGAQRADRVAPDTDRRARRDAQSGAEAERLEKEIETTTNAIPRRGRARGNKTRGRGKRGRG